MVQRTPCVLLPLMAVEQPTSASQRQADELSATWHCELAGLDARLRASGRTVTYTEPSNTDELTVTFPQGTPPARSGPGPVPVERGGKVSALDALPVAAAGKRFARALGQVIGAKPAAAAIAHLLAGRLDEAPLAEMENLLSDEMANSHRTVWVGVIRTEDDEHGVEIQQYEGVFSHWVAQFGRTGYFLSEDDALEHLHGKHEGVEQVRRRRR